MTRIFDRTTGPETRAAEIAVAHREAVCRVWLRLHYTKSTPPPVRAEILENNAARDAYCGPQP